MLCTEELFLRTRYIKISPQIRQVKMYEGEDSDSQHDTSSGPAGFHASQLVFCAIHRVSDKYGFPYNYFVIREDE